VPPLSSRFDMTHSIPKLEFKGVSNPLGKGRNDGTPKNGKVGRGLGNQKLKNASSFLVPEDQKREVPIVWDIIQSEYDSGPKTGID